MTTNLNHSPYDNGIAKTSYRNQITNTAVLLEIVQAIFEVLDKVPYIKLVAALPNTGIKILNVSRQFSSLY
jgi:hypothetical protein